MSDGLTYSESGVDINAGEAAVEKIKGAIRSTYTKGVVSEIGGFGGAFEIDKQEYDSPVLISTTDGVGTKAVVAGECRQVDTIGLDLVAMCVDDLVCVGAKPLFMLDYISIGKVDPDYIERIVSGIAKGCKLAGAALIGGEMAEHSGEFAPGHFDLAGFAVGIVEKERILGSENILGDEVLIGLSSPGIRSNGYTLARKALLSDAGLHYEDELYPGSTVSEALLEPSVIYAPLVTSLIASFRQGIRSIAHVTGGGLLSNLTRVIPPNSKPIVDRDSWEVPKVFKVIQEVGHIETEEMYRVFNMGIGMVMAVTREIKDEVLKGIEKSEYEAQEIGHLSKI
ncbi:MAG: phosphoribosylformylglycinamidine cyclo-ligase [Acidimicrobiales bacterium]|nr:phosphoribosylformylglycinamidine cyclo-ligase [Acidimicrobiales bacterium]